MHRFDSFEKSLAYRSGWQDAVRRMRELLVGRPEFVTKVEVDGMLARVEELK